MYIAPPLNGFPLELGIGALGQKNKSGGATGSNKNFDDIFSRVDQLDRQTDRQTDRHRTTAKTALTHSVARVKRDVLSATGFDF